MFNIAFPSSESTCQNPSANPRQTLTDITSLHPLRPTSSSRHISAVAHRGFRAEQQTQQDQEKKEKKKTKRGRIMRHTQDNPCKKRRRVSKRRIQRENRQMLDKNRQNIRRHRESIQLINASESNVHRSLQPRRARFRDIISQQACPDTHIRRDESMNENPNAITKHP